jgi:hypothetical protein
MKFEAYEQTLGRGASPFVKWTITPFLLLFGFLFVLQSFECHAEGRMMGLLFCIGITVMCLCGILALWGVPHIGRVVTGGIGLFSAWYLIDECVIHFDGHWGFGGRRSATTPVNSILAFLLIGLPCLLYTILGRSTLRPADPEADVTEDGFEDEFDDDDDDCSKGATDSEPPEPKPERK